MSTQNRDGVTQQVTVTVQDANDGGTMLGELVQVIEVGGGVIGESLTNIHGQAHFHLEPGEYRFELLRPERVTSKRNRIVIPAPGHELHICFGIES